MSDLKNSYKLSELPDNLMLSPKFLFDWWDDVVELFGRKVALNDKSPDFRLGRELWVAAVFASCMRVSSDKEHWVSAVSGEAPDALVARFDIDSIGTFRQIYQIEVTEYDDNAESLRQVIEKKLSKAYDPTTRIVCYMTRRKDDFEVNFEELIDSLRYNNPRDYEVWLLGGSSPGRDAVKSPQKLLCLTTCEDYQIDLAEQKLVPNQSEALLVPTAKSINKDGKFSLLGKIILEYPVQS